MSDNIIIGVHGQAQTLEGINGINAKEATGGSTNYVPENTLKVGGKTVTQNGTYNAADDNMLGYKRVVVMDLASEGKTKAYQDTRKHNAMIACGGRQRIFANVKKLRAKDVNNADYIVASAPILRTKSLNVSHPGVYDVSNETDADVYTPVYVSVSDSERDAAGFNPINPTWQDNLPDEIRVTTLPTKMVYNEGEKIDYTGMVVKAYKNGTLWSNENYPGGVIPLEELEMDKTYYEYGRQNVHAYVKFDQSLIKPGTDRSWIPEGFYINKKNDFYGYTIEAGGYRSDGQGKVSHAGCYGYIGYKDGWAPDQIYGNGEIILAVFVNKYSGIIDSTMYCIGLNGTTGMYYDYGGISNQPFGTEFNDLMHGAQDALFVNMSRKHNQQTGTMSEWTYNGFTTRYGKMSATTVGEVCEINAQIDMDVRKNYIFYDDIPFTTVQYSYDLPNTNKYSDAIIYSIFFSPRGFGIKWKRPVDNQELSTHLWINKGV